MRTILAILLLLVVVLFVAGGRLFRETRQGVAYFDGSVRGLEVGAPVLLRGIRIGSARDGFVTAFIPDPETDQDNSGTSGAEGVAVDAEGNIYGAEVGPRTVKKYVRSGAATQSEGIRPPVLQ